MRTRQRPRAVIRRDVRGHPAVMAWVAVTGRARVPSSVTVLRERQAPRKAIYLLSGVGDEGAGVFAKRARAAVILIERRIYEEILPALPLTAPRCYGSCLDGSDGWLFLEDVGELRYSRDEPEHLRATARWLATMHAAAARLATDGLPESGPPRYLRHLRGARAKIHACLGRWHLAATEIEVLVDLLGRCDALEARWSYVEASCAGLPNTLVHGDFQSKNAHLRAAGGTLEVLPIDWEMAGWGSPAKDLTRIDLPAYWEVARREWPGIDLATIERLARIGRVLEYIAAVDWESESLRLERADHRSDAVSNLAVLRDRLRDAARAARMPE